MSAQPLATLLQITDLHILPKSGDTLYGVDTEKTFAATLAQALAEHPNIDCVLITGDLTHEPCPSAYRRILKQLEILKVPCICLPGNHDDWDMMQAILSGDDVDCRKQRFLSGWQVICLNSLLQGSPRGHLSVSELGFLDECLAAYPHSPALIAVHHHCVDTGSAWMDTMIIDNSGELLSIAAKHPQVKMIICGHIHQLMDRRFDGIRIVATPSTCFQFKPDSSELGIDDCPPAYRIIELYDQGQVETAVFSAAGQDRDF